MLPSSHKPCVGPVLAQICSFYGMEQKPVEKPKGWPCPHEGPRSVPSAITFALRCPPANGSRFSDALLTTPLYGKRPFLQPLPKESL